MEVQPTVEGLPVQAYVTREEVAGGGRDLVRTFVHVPTEVGAFDAESVGVEHLLRDINNPSTSNLAGDIQGKLVGLKGLTARLGEISAYLEKVLDGRLPQNNELLNQLQVSGARGASPRGGRGRGPVADDPNAFNYYGSYPGPGLAPGPLEETSICV